MNPSSNPKTPLGDPLNHPGAAFDALAAGTTSALPEWIDSSGRSWRLEILPDAITLHGQDRLLTLPMATWTRDILVTPHGERLVLRFDTFDLSLTFVLPAAKARPLLQHLGRVMHQQRESTSSDEKAGVSPAILQPRVSAHAVWALICSSVVFVPAVGLVPLVFMGVLLVMHRKRVPARREWSHSRRICQAAMVLAVVGLPVNALGTLGWMRFGPQALSTDSRPSHAITLVAERHTAAASTSAVEPPGVGLIAQSDVQPWRREHNWGLIATGFFVILLSLSVHEAAHAVTAWWQGDDFARRLGRVTLNPTAHIDPFGTVVLPLLLFLAGAGVFGWARPVPVRSENFMKPRRAQILVALAGPGSNLLLAAAALMLWLGIGCSVALVWPGADLQNYASIQISEMVRASGFPLAPIVGPVCTILKITFVLNVFLAFFNLIPLPPLDGSWVLEHLFPRTLGPLYARTRNYGFFIFLLLIYSDVLKYLLLPVAYALAPAWFLTMACTPFT